jgi:hypothetical protein
MTLMPMDEFGTNNNANDASLYYGRIGKCQSSLNLKVNCTWSQKS